jgi:DNA-binding CsgD family transcriptional regulator
MMNLLERENALQELDTALREAAVGEGRVIFVRGEAGIGKTSLIEHFNRIQKHAIRVLWGVCDSLFIPRPLGPLYDIAAQVKGDLLARLLSESNRTAIFTSLLTELQQKTTIVVIDDVHWADEATLDLLKFLGRRIQRTQALLIITFRDDELGSQHPLHTLLGDLATSPFTRRITLTALSIEAVHTLVGDRPVDADALHQQTGGNPFFVTELLANSASGVPSTVRDAVLSRAARLSPSSQSVLEAAAVIGARVEVGLLVAVTGTEDFVIDQCLASGILLAQGDGLAFRHELARQTILESLSPPRRKALHHMVLTALKALPYANRDLAQLAHHAEAASDREAILEYTPIAARKAAAASAHREAAALYALAIRYANDLPAMDRASLLESYAAECFLVDQQQEAIAARRKAVELWGEENNFLKQGENLAHLTASLIAVGKNAEAEEAIKTAIVRLEQLPPGRELALAYRVQATFHLVNRDCHPAIEWAEKAIALAQRFGDATVEATAHNTVGTALLFVDYNRGCEYLEQRLAYALESGLETRAAIAYTNLGSGSGELCQFVQARSYLEEGIAYASERDLDYTRHYMVAWLALTHLHLGHWGEVISTIHELLQRADLSTITRIVNLVTLGRLHARRGDPGATTLDEALNLAMQTETLQRLAPVRAARAEAAWLAGDRERTLAEARAVYELAASKQHPWLAGELAFWRWCAGDEMKIYPWMAKPFALHIAGNWEAAAAEWKRLGCPYEQARALADGDAAAQVAALAIFDQLDARPAADNLRQQMRSAGISSIPRGPRPITRENPFGLTSRQLEILNLLGENLTNPEIAARLNISPKTVDHHVSAVLAKLDVHSRGEAAKLTHPSPLPIPK